MSKKGSHSSPKHSRQGQKKEQLHSGYSNEDKADKKDSWEDENSQGSGRASSLYEDEEWEQQKSQP